MSRIRPAPRLPLAALKWGAASSDKVDCGSDASLDNLTAAPFSVITLIYPTTFTVDRTMLSKIGTKLGYSTAIADTSGNWYVTVGHATTNLTYTTSDIPFKLNGWYWCAAVVDLSLGAGLRAVLYSGKLGGPLSINALTLTEPSGARGDDAAVNQHIGSRQDVATRAFQGSIALAAVWNRGLPFEEFARLTKGGGAGFRESNPVGLWRPGLNTKGGTVVHDESGNPNHGTVTGAVQSGVRVSL